jgi:hypothetical protein
MTDPVALSSGAVLRAVLRRALGSGKTEIRESEFVRYARTTVIGTRNVVNVDGDKLDAQLRALAVECVRVAAQTPGLSVTLTVRDGESVLEVLHKDEAAKWLNDETPQALPEDVGSTPRGHLQASPSDVRRRKHPRQLSPTPSATPAPHRSDAESSPRPSATPVPHRVDGGSDAKSRPRPSTPVHAADEPITRARDAAVEQERRSQELAVLLAAAQRLPTRNLRHHVALWLRVGRSGPEQLLKILPELHGHRPADDETRRAWRLILQWAGCDEIRIERLLSGQRA